MTRIHRQYMKPPDILTSLLTSTPTQANYTLFAAAVYLHTKPRSLADFLVHSNLFLVLHVAARAAVRIFRSFFHVLRLVFSFRQFDDFRSPEREMSSAHSLTLPKLRKRTSAQHPFRETVFQSFPPH
jgi:hypothetical protein